MQALSPALIAKLTAPKKTKPVAQASKPKQANTGGAFEGKVGSMARSRKGVTRRKANGRRFYVPTIEEWQSVGLYKSGF